MRLRHTVPRAARVQEIRWEAVERWDGLRIVLRDDPPVREIDLGPGPAGEIPPGNPFEPRGSDSRERE